jgi:hypothetical protein
MPTRTSGVSQDPDECHIDRPRAHQAARSAVIPTATTRVRIGARFRLRTGIRLGALRSTTIPNAQSRTGDRVLLKNRKYG